MSLDRSQRRWAFSALILATVIAVLDMSAINLALPTIADSLGLGIGDVLWLSKANLLACSIAILPCAAVGDVLGHRRVFYAGLLTFALTATGCALSSELWEMIVLRAIQGCASAAIMCSSLVLLREIFPAKLLGSALGFNALFVAVATTTGPAISGLILTFLSWRWLFALSPLLALSALWLGWVYLPEKRSIGSRFDGVGALLLIGTASVLLKWYLSPESTWLGVPGLLLASIFIWHQHRTHSPILPLSLFSNLRLDYALMASVIAFIGQSCAFIALPLAFQQELGFSPMAAAGLFVAWPLATALIGPCAGKWADRGSPRAVACAGISILALGLAALASLPANAQPIDIIWRTALCGIGFGLFQSPNNREILTNAIAQHSARTAALLSAARLIGQALGAVMVGIALSQGQTSRLTPIPQLLWYACALQLGSLLVGALMWFACSKQSRSTRSSISR
ncbi:MFS transporter [Pseudomonas sp. UBA4194]|uniref:MFS transporter n=1 Tax=Pseudomonas sp. UBA4194 TaxID=1947317 RepID=UPI0025D5BC3B|nr:MFS transporter [Pseudomonas sp. UBA4194]